MTGVKTLDTAWGLESRRERFSPSSLATSEMVITDLLS